MFGTNACSIVLFIAFGQVNFIPTRRAGTSNQSYTYLHKFIDIDKKLTKNCMFGIGTGHGHCYFASAIDQSEQFSKPTVKKCLI